MNEEPPCPINLVVEEPSSDTTFHEVILRMIQFFRCGIARYWLVDEENQTIHMCHPRRFFPPDGYPLPSDVDQLVAEFFPGPDKGPSHP